MEGTREKLPAEARHELTHREDVVARIRRLLIEDLKVAIPADHIDLDAPLFGTGIGLDSVDGIELVVAVEREFSLHIPQGAVGPWPFRTVHSLVDFVMSPPPSVVSMAVAVAAVGAEP